MEKQLNFSQLDTLASNLAAIIKPNDIILLIGDLGTGKTTFTKQFGKALGVTQTIKSPTFNIVSEYFSGRFPLFHFDVYRLTNPYDFLEVGYEYYSHQNGVMVVEWGDIVESVIIQEYIKIELKHCDETSRFASISIKNSNLKREQEIEACIP